MLKELTKEQEALTQVVVDKYLRIVRQPSGGADITADDPDVLAAVELIYRCCDKPTPKDIRIVDSIRAANRMAQSLLDPGYTAQPNGCFVAEAPWTARHDFYHLIKVLSDEEYRDTGILERAMFKIWDCVLLEDCAILVLHPISISTDENGLIHNGTGPAIIWRSACDYKDRPGVAIPGEYAWHGIVMTEQLIEHPETVTPEQYAALGADQRRAFGERFGWANVCAMLGAKSIEQAVINGLEYELLRAGNSEQWLKMQSPELKTGERPFHIEPVHEDLKTIAGARKWRCADDPIKNRWWTPEECEADPTLIVGQHA
jgi:hypothetical protein